MYRITLYSFISPHRIPGRLDLTISIPCLQKPQYYIRSTWRDSELKKKDILPSSVEILDSLYITDCVSSEYRLRSSEGKSRGTHLTWRLSNTEDKSRRKSNIFLMWWSATQTRPSKSIVFFCYSSSVLIGLIGKPLLSSTTVPGSSQTSGVYETGWIVGKDGIMYELV